MDNNKLCKVSTTSFINKYNTSSSGGNAPQPNQVQVITDSVCNAIDQQLKQGGFGNKIYYDTTSQADIVNQPQYTTTFLTGASQESLKLVNLDWNVTNTDWWFGEMRGLSNPYISGNESYAYWGDNDKLSANVKVAYKPQKTNINLDKVIVFPNINTDRVTSAIGMFCADGDGPSFQIYYPNDGCYNLTCGVFNFPNLVSAQYMFAGCRNLRLSHCHFNFQKVVNANSMFCNFNVNDNRSPLGYTDPSGFNNGLVTLKLNMPRSEDLDCIFNQQYGYATNTSQTGDSYVGCDRMYKPINFDITSKLMPMRPFLCFYAPDQKINNTYVSPIYKLNIKSAADTLSLKNMFFRNYMTKLIWGESLIIVTSATKLDFSSFIQSYVEELRLDVGDKQIVGIDNMITTPTNALYIKPTQRISCPVKKLYMNSNSESIVPCNLLVYFVSTNIMSSQAAPLTYELSDNIKIKDLTLLTRLSYLDSASITSTTYKAQLQGIQYWSFKFNASKMQYTGLMQGIRGQNVNWLSHLYGNHFLGGQHMVKCDITGIGATEANMSVFGLADYPNSTITERGATDGKIDGETLMSNETCSDSLSLRSPYTSTPPCFIKLYPTNTMFKTWQKQSDGTYAKSDSTIQEMWYNIEQYLIDEYANQDGNTLTLQDYINVYNYILDNPYNMCEINNSGVILGPSDSPYDQHAFSVPMDCNVTLQTTKCNTYLLNALLKKFAFICCDRTKWYDSSFTAGTPRCTKFKISLRVLFRLSRYNYDGSTHYTNCCDRYDDFADILLYHPNLIRNNTNMEQIKEVTILLCTNSYLMFNFNNDDGVNNGTSIWGHNPQMKFTFAIIPGDYTDNTKFNKHFVWIKPTTEPLEWNTYPYLYSQITSTPTELFPLMGNYSSTVTNLNTQPTQL